MTLGSSPPLLSEMVQGKEIITSEGVFRIKNVGIKETIIKELIFNRARQGSYN
jgi:hypothetical protein